MLSHREGGLFDAVSCFLQAWIYIPQAALLQLSTHVSALLLFYVTSSIIQAFQLVFTHNLWEDRRIADIMIKNFSFFFYLKQIDTMLLYIRSVINQGRHESVVWTWYLVKPGYRLKCHFFVLATFSHHLWSILGFQSHN